MNIRPRKQSWRGNHPPSEEDHKRFLKGLKEKKLLGTLQMILKGCNGYLRGRKERKAGAKTCESGYLFISKKAFQEREPWIVCIDAPGTSLRIIIRPIPTNKGSYNIITPSLQNEFQQCADNHRWAQRIITTEKEMIIARLAIDILICNYKSAFKNDE